MAPGLYRDIILDTPTTLGKHEEGNTNLSVIENVFNIFKIMSSSPSLGMIG